MARQHHITTDNRDEIEAWIDHLLGKHTLTRELGSNATTKLAPTHALREQ